MSANTLTVEQVVRIGEACAENAYALLDDAALLASNGRVVRAFFLTTIAAEEFAKYLMCRDRLNSWSGALTAAELEKRLRLSHEERRELLLDYFRLLSPNTPLPPGFDNLTALVKQEQAARNRALYVGVHESGDAMTPEGVSPNDAARYVRAMGEVLTTLRATVRGGLDSAAERARSRFL